MVAQRCRTWRACAVRKSCAEPGESSHTGAEAKRLVAEVRAQAFLATLMRLNITTDKETAGKALGNTLRRPSVNPRPGGRSLAKFRSSSICLFHSVFPQAG